MKCIEPMEATKLKTIRYMLNRIYIPYTEWEDFKYGMWRKLPSNEEDKMLKICIKFTGDYLKYGQAMSEVIFKWNNTMLNSLTNISINRKAFLGHCAAQYKINCPEYITRMAWKYLSLEQQILANKQAEINIKKWQQQHEIKNRKIHTGMGTQMLLQWDT